MTSQWKLASLLASSCVGLLACGQRQIFEGYGENDAEAVAEDSEPPPNDLPKGDGDGDGDDDADGDGDGEPFACEADELMCDGVCVNPLLDNQNCGACGRTCVFELDPTIQGGCYQGECRPLYSPCFAATAEPTTCAQVCAASGESCADLEQPNGCWAVAVGWAADDVDRCEMHDPGAGFGYLGCNDPLPYGETKCGPEDAPCTHFVCCCTQTPGGG